MAKRDIIVIGASAGGIEALSQLTAELPPQLPASLFVVVHMSSELESRLPLIVERQGSIQVVAASPDQPIEHGRMYIAVPDYHLLVDNGRVHLWRGPRENRCRPAVNALFRSAAVAYRERVIGVVLSGCLDDGSTGLWWVKQFNGVAVVQDPSDAKFPAMPENAIKYVTADYILRAREIGRLLPTLVAGIDREALEKS